MKLFSFAIPKINVKKNISWLALSIVVLVLIGSFVWLGKTGKLSNFNWQSLTAKIPFVAQQSDLIVQEEIPKEELKITFPELNKVYEETAEKGEGITHLARKALKRYLSERKVDFEITAEHKIYIEDYLQKKTGNHWLKIGEKVSFSEELIKEAISASQKLTPSQLENLKQFSSQVIFP